MPAKGGLIILKRGGLKDVRITGEAASVHPAAAYEFTDTIKKKQKQKQKQKQKTKNKTGGERLSS